jgi:hypothetical protein
MFSSMKKKKKDKVYGILGIDKIEDSETEK